MTLHSLASSGAADLALAWLLTYALHSTVLLTGAWAVSRRLRGRSLRFQETLWRCALAGALVTASAQLALGSLGLAPLGARWTLASAGAAGLGAAHGAPVGGGASSAAGTAAPDRTGREVALAASGVVIHSSGERLAVPTWPGDAPVGQAGRAGAGSPTALLSSQHSSSTAWAGRGIGSLPAARLLLPAWLLGALLLVLAYGRSYLLLRRRLRFRPQVVGGGVLERLASLLRASAISRRVRLTCSWRLRVPVALGGRRAEVCVPPRALFVLSDEQQEALLAHELAHLERRDPIWLPLTQLLVSVFFFQPLNWLARRRLRELSEMLCDEWAVARTGRPLSLAGCLAEVAGWSTAALGPRAGRRELARLPVPGMADRTSHLARRIRRLLDGTPLEGAAPPPRARQVTLLAAVLLAVALVAPGVSAGAPAEKPAAAPAPATEGAATEIDSSTPEATAWESASGTSAAGVAEAPGSAATAAVADTPAAAASAPTEAPGPAAAPSSALSGLAAKTAPVAASVGGPAASAASAPATAAHAGAATAPSAPGPAALAVVSGSPGSEQVVARSAEPKGGETLAGLPARASSPAVAGETPDCPLQVPEVADLEIDDEQLAATAAKLGQLDKLSSLSQEQIAAISASVERISRQIDSQMKARLQDLDRQVAASLGALPRQSPLSAEELADLEGELAGLAGQLRPSPQQMAQLESELRNLAAHPPRLSPEQLARIQQDLKRDLANLPHLGLTKEQLARIHSEVKRALEQSAAARRDALSTAERDKLLADARRLAEQARPDQAQLDSLRTLAKEHADLARLLAEQRTEIESMRREILRQTESFRDLARREAEARRAHPHPKPAPRQHPSAPSGAAPAPPPASHPEPAPPAPQPPAAPPAPAPSAATPPPPQPPPAP
jgi:BlaR1 peptidase M56